MSSIYDQTIISELHDKIEDAQSFAEQASVAAENARQTAAEQRSLARQYSALLAHAEGRQTDHDQMVEQTAHDAKHRLALSVAIDLLDAGLPEVLSWTVGRRDGELDIHINSRSDQPVAALETWLKHLGGGEITGEPYQNTIHHKASVVYRDVPVKLTVIGPAPKDDDTPESDTAEPESAGAVA
jgi:hypothetical protein